MKDTSVRKEASEVPCLEAAEFAEQQPAGKGMSLPIFGVLRIFEGVVSGLLSERGEMGKV